jgi:hypothetical protein
MRNCLLRAKLWNVKEHSDALKEIIRECPCEKARKPSTPPKVSLSTITKGQELCIDVVCFEWHPYLHAEDKHSGSSACVCLNDRSISTEIADLKIIWIDNYGKPSFITADTEYDKLQFHKFCDSIGSRLSIVATDAHNQNGVNKSGNRIIRMVFRKFRVAEQQLRLQQVIENAIYGKNCCTGSKNASSYELWFEQIPSIAGRPKPIQAAFEAKQARAKVFRAIRAGTRSHTDVHPGRFVKFFRNMQGWSEPCQVVSVSGNIVTIIHNIYTKLQPDPALFRVIRLSLYLSTQSCAK